jgi:YfiH family protein
MTTSATTISTCLRFSSDVVARRARRLGMIRIDRPLVGGRCASVVLTSRLDGDFRPDAPGVAERRRAIVDTPWTELRQVHGAKVVVVRRPGAESGTAADGAVTSVPGAALSIRTADCAPIALIDTTGVVGVVHAGWRGLVAGVVGATVDAMAALGARQVHAVVGPCIGPAQYEFGTDDLDTMAAVFGDAVRASTRAETPALDLPAAVRVALARSGVVDIDERCVDTASDPEYFSHRARREIERQVMVAWVEAS